MNATASNLSLPAQSCVTRFELAQVLHVSVRTVDRMIAAGEIRVRRVRGKSVRFLQSDVERYLGTEEKTISSLHPDSIPVRGEVGINQINQTKNLKPTKPAKTS